MLFALTADLVLIVSFYGGERGHFKREHFKEGHFNGGESQASCVLNVKFADYSDCGDKLQLLRVQLLHCIM